MMITGGVKKCAAIARTTFLEAIQQPVAFLILLFSVTLTLIVPIFQFHHFGEEGRLARDSGLSCMLIFGMALAVGTAGRSVAGEIADGTAAAVLAKPVSRPLFLVSKWLGCVAAVLFFWVGQLAALLVSEHASAHFVMEEQFTGLLTDPLALALAIGGVGLALAAGAALHFFRHKRFGVSVFTGIALSQTLAAAATGFYDRANLWYLSRGGAAVRFFYHSDLNLRAVPAALLVLLGLLVFAALATALATRMRAGTVFAVCAGALLFGLTGDSLLAEGGFFSARGLLAGVFPDLQHFWMCDAIAHGGRVGGAYMAAAAGYALTCCALFLAAGCLAFDRRDLG